MTTLKKLSLHLNITVHVQVVYCIVIDSNNYSHSNTTNTHINCSWRIDGINTYFNLSVNCISSKDTNRFVMDSLLVLGLKVGYISLREIEFTHLMFTFRLKIAIYHLLWLSIYVLNKHFYGQMIYYFVLITNWW